MNVRAHQKILLKQVATLLFSRGKVVPVAELIHIKIVEVSAIEPATSWLKFRHADLYNIEAVIYRYNILYRYTNTALNIFDIFFLESKAFAI